MEALLLVLLVLTVAAVAWRAPLLERTIRLNPQSVSGKPYLVHTDKAVGGTSTAGEEGALRWNCDLRPAFQYPYCGYEIFFDHDFGTNGLDLTNLRSMTVTLLYRGPAARIRMHLKNFDPRYSQGTRDDSSKFNRVEYPAQSGQVQEMVFTADDFGVADWWLVKHGVPANLSHPQFDNITSIDVQTGSDSVVGHHEFEVREIVLRRAALSDAQFYLLLLGLWCLLLGSYLIWRIRGLRVELERRDAMQAMVLAQARQAAIAARLDHLTQVYNRRGIGERYDELTVASIDAPMPVALILVDIDAFKSLNDRFGHTYGDEVLSGFAQLIKRNIRSGDTVGRWGGEEFLVICPGIDSDGAMVVAEKLRRLIEEHHFGEGQHVTASFGVHCCPAAGPDLLALVGHADVALYAAKHAGRNRSKLFRAGMAKAA